MIEFMRADFHFEPILLLECCAKMESNEALFMSAFQANESEMAHAESLSSEHT
jgi:hypothetical protein